MKIIEETKKNCNGHSKRFRFIMSHRTGKIEILGIFKNELYFKYHQAKNRNKIGKIFKRPLTKTEGWLENPQHSAVEVMESAAYLL